jgi:uncharacterized peroxidase-related enzyme
MSWTRSIPPDEADGDLVRVYGRIRALHPEGRVGLLWQACGPAPAMLDALFTLVRAVMDHPAPLSRAQAEAIVVAVSAVNGCGYCLAHHGPRLARALGDEELARAVARDYRAADLPACDRVLLDYAVALTCEPAERTDDDVERLREYGFDDAAVLRAATIAALFNLVNRLILGLGVGLEADVAPWESALRG